MPFQPPPLPVPNEDYFEQLRERERQARQPERAQPRQPPPRRESVREARLTVPANLSERAREAAKADFENAERVRSLFQGWVFHLYQQGHEATAARFKANLIAAIEAQHASGLGFVASIRRRADTRERRDQEE